MAKNFVPERKVTAKINICKGKCTHFVKIIILSIFIGEKKFMIEIEKITTLLKLVFYYFIRIN